MIRIAQKGYSTGGAARSLDDVVAGVGVHWIEVDGVRLTAKDHRLVDVEIHVEEGVTVPRFTIGVTGPVEFVYLGPDDEELGAAPVAVEDLPDRIGGRTALARP